jgi:hypothetical protein
VARFVPATNEPGLHNSGILERIGTRHRGAYRAFSRAGANVGLSRINRELRIWPWIACYQSDLLPLTLRASIAI